MQPIFTAMAHGRRAAWLVVGIVALLLGAVGAVLPVLPTTPFVILAAFAFGKSIPAFRQKLLDSRVFGPMIHDWESYGAIAPRYKIIAGSMMAMLLALSIAMSVKPAIIIVQAVCMVLAFGYVVTRPNGPKA